MTFVPKSEYQYLEEMVLQTAELIRPPERLSVSEAAERYVFINKPGAYVGRWDNNYAPYLVEVMDTLTSLDFTGCIFVAPARAGKSQIFLNWIAHTMKCDPADMMLVHMTQAAVRDWAKMERDQLFRYSKDIGALKMPGRQHTNTHDMRFKSGAMLLAKWPTITELSGKTIRYMGLSDYDRMGPTGLGENIDGEGDAFGLARKRTASFGRYGMTYAESSPGSEFTDGRWLPSGKHEAPPVRGILDLYNQGDRRRWYWPCAGCGEWFEPDFHLLQYPIVGGLLERAEQVVLPCPSCGFVHTHDPTEHSPGKSEMNRRGKWIGEEGRRSDIASFWLKSPAAISVSWKELVHAYLKAVDSYEKTGSEEALRRTVTGDQGLPYVPRRSQDTLLPETLKAQAGGYEKGTVPKGVRYLLATVDVQKSAFAVGVWGFGINDCIWAIDRFDITKADRLDEDKEHCRIEPASYAEDWRVLIDRVALLTYPLADDSGRVMQIKATASDSGGRSGVTGRAYEFWRWLRDKCAEPANLHRRFHLVRGDPTPGAPHVKIGYPNSDRKDRHAGARGDEPVVYIGSNHNKDMVAGWLTREDGDQGRVYFPNGMPDSFYEELTAETRTQKGWENLNKRRNETWDLLCYAFAVSFTRYVAGKRIDWSNPPSWAAEWDKNDLISKKDEPRRFDSGSGDLTERLRKLAESLN